MRLSIQDNDRLRLRVTGMYVKNLLRYSYMTQEEIKTRLAKVEADLTGLEKSAKEGIAFAVEAISQEALQVVRAKIAQQP